MTRPRALLFAVFILISGCVHTPPGLTPQAQLAFQATRVVTVLDVFRDAAMTANALTPPAISTDSTRQIVLWHKAAVQIIQASPSGWVPAVKSGLYGLTCSPLAAPTPATPCTPTLSAAEVARLAPYTTIVLAVLQEVQ